MQTAAEEIKWGRLRSNCVRGNMESRAEAAAQRGVSEEDEPEGNLLNRGRGRAECCTADDNAAICPVKYSFASELLVIPSAPSDGKSRKSEDVIRTSLWKMGGRR